MRSTLRSLLLLTTLALGGGAFAQLQYWAVVYGQVSGCTPGQAITVSTSFETQTVTVDANCGYAVSVFSGQTPDVVVASTNCQGAVQTVIDTVTFNGFLDSALVNINFNCGGGQYDCTGLLNGPNMPGTACNDGDPMTFADVWSPNCVCMGTDTSIVYDCLQIPNGPNLPGTWCTNFMGDTGVWSPNCVCMVDSGFVIYDCLGIANGPNMPGSPCIGEYNGMTYAGIWQPNCYCLGDSLGNLPDCLGIPGGSNLPGTACDDNDPMTNFSYWNIDCVCVSDSANYYDCLQIPNGPNVPGSPCMAFGVVGTWNSQCMCVPNNPNPCQADFWVIQAMGNDSLPIPYELWIWNLTSGGSGVYTYNWSFGDGTSSIEAYPTHTYSGNGPYNLCLTIADNNGCTSVHCDSISIDANGIYNGMAGNGGDRQDGFTINIRNPLTTSINDMAGLTDLALWPNPANELVNVAVNSTITGSQQVTVTDLNGRVVLSERHNLSGGRTQFTLSTAQLTDGIYMVRIGNSNASQRFVKTH